MGEPQKRHGHCGGGRRDSTRLKFASRDKSHIGRKVGAVTRSSIVFLAFSTLMTCAAQAQDCQLKMYDSMDINVATNHVLVPVTLGDAHKEFALKIGNALNGISQDLVSELGLSVRSVAPNVHVIRDQVQISKLTNVPKFQLGKIPLNNLEFIVLPPEANPEKFEGDIGARILSKTDFELDIAGKNSTFFLKTIAKAKWCIGRILAWLRFRSYGRKLATSDPSCSSMAVLSEFLLMRMALRRLA